MSDIQLECPSCSVGQAFEVLIFLWWLSREDVGLKVFFLEKRIIKFKFYDFVDLISKDRRFEMEELIVMFHVCSFL